MRMITAAIDINNFQGHSACVATDDNNDDTTPKNSINWQQQQQQQQQSPLLMWHRGYLILVNVMSSGFESHRGLCSQ